MNDLTTAAVERLTAQLGEALFNQPGLDLIEIANRCNAEAALAGGALLGSTAYPIAWSWVGRDHSTHFTEEADTAAEAHRLGKVVRPLYGHASASPKPAKPEAVRLRDELRERAATPELCEECGRQTFHNHPDGYICLHCKLIVGARHTHAHFALDALVAAGHVEQSKVDQALAIGADLASVQPSPAVAVGDDLIREVFLRNGFTIKDGQQDLKPYVFAAARDLLSIVPPPSPAGKAVG